MISFYRELEFKQIQSFINSRGSGLVFVRGRRRVGKSWLLKEIEQKETNVLYIMGALDATGSKAIKLFASALARYLQNSLISKIEADQLDWMILFDQITMHSKHNKIVIILDEIQWLAKNENGLISSIKQAWLDWEKSENIKLIICGSSQKFFSQMAQGEEAILRGLKTHSDIWIHPFSLRQIKQEYFAKYNLEEVALIYMMVGGIPYYLQQIDPNNSFIGAINEAIFTQKTIFLEEIDEVLKLETNSRGLTTLKKLIKALGQDGCTQKNICIKTGLADSTVSELIEKMLEFKIVFEKNNLADNIKKNASGKRYFLKDFYLNFYCQILTQLQNRISENQKGLIFPYSVLSSPKGYYIENFSGKAFELLIRVILERKQFNESNVFEKLNLSDPNYTVDFYQDPSCEIDLVVNQTSERCFKLIECKWLSHSSTFGLEMVQSLASKTILLKESYSHYSIQKYIICSQEFSAAMIKKAAELNVTLIGLKELF